MTMEDDEHLEIIGEKEFLATQETCVCPRYHPPLKEDKGIYLWICKDSKNIFQEPNPKSILKKKCLEKQENIQN